MKKISTQISVATLSLFLVGFIILLLVVDNLLRRNLQAELVDNLKVQCRLLDEVLPFHPDSIRSQLPRYSDLIVARITILDDQGRVLSDFDGHRFTNTIENHIARPEIQDALRSVDGFGSSIRHSGTIDEDLVYAAYHSPHHRFLRIAQRQSFIDSVIRKVRWIFFSAAFGAVVLVFLLSINISKRITRPLSDIVAAASEIKDGNYNKEIIVKEQNEVGELGKILNAMSAKFKSDIHQLNQLQEIRKDFVANASHELRTPVSSVRGYIETLLDGAYHDEAVSKKFLERAHSNVLRLENIVTDMLDLSRLESREKSLSLRYVDVGVSLKNIVTDVEEMANKKDLTIRLENTLPPEFRLLADPYQFEKAVINLAENAVKYTENGSIVVRSYLKDRSLAIEVEDTGNGIKAEELPRIFERFYRVDKGRSREQGGSGLGLAIVKHVMEIHKGSVQVESEPGKGTKFTLTFPVS